MVNVDSTKATNGEAFDRPRFLREIAATMDPTSADKQIVLGAADEIERLRAALFELATDPQYGVMPDVAAMILRTLENKP